MKIKVSKKHGNIKESATFSYENFDDTIKYARNANKAIIDIDLTEKNNIIFLEEIVKIIMEKLKIDEQE